MNYFERFIMLNEAVPSPKPKKPPTSPATKPPTEPPDFTQDKPGGNDINNEPPPDNNTPPPDPNADTSTEPPPDENNLEGPPDESTDPGAEPPPEEGTDPGMDTGTGEDPSAAGDPGTEGDMGAEGGEGDPSAEGGEEGTEDPNAAGDTGEDPSAAGAETPPDNDAEIFGDLSQEQIDLKKRELKLQFQTLSQSISTTIDKIDNISRTSYDLNTIAFVLKKLVNLKEITRDSLIYSFDTKNYIENKVCLNQIIAAYQMILKILEQIKQNRIKIAQINDKKAHTSKNMQRFTGFSKDLDYY